MRGNLLRFALLLLLGLAAQAAVAQTYRVVTLWHGEGGVFGEAFTQQLASLGHIQGKNLVIESLSAGGNPARYPEIAREAVRRKPEVIFAPTRGLAQAAREATRTIPIVFAFAPDPVSDGLIASLARPGGNLTGVSNIQTGLTAKRLQLMQEMIPRLARIGAIYDASADKVAADQAKELQWTALELKIELHLVAAGTREEFAQAFAKFDKLKVQAVFVAGSVASYRERGEIAALALKHRLPTMNASREYVDAGGLLSYGPDLEALVRKAATYVDQILKGAKAADLPVQQPEVFETVLNLKTVRTLGLKIPQSLRMRADRMIE